MPASVAANVSAAAVRRIAKLAIVLPSLFDLPGCSA
jgi:hypothetical protein